MKIKIELINGKIEVFKDSGIENKDDLFNWIENVSDYISGGVKFIRIEQEGKKDRYIMIDKIVKIEEFEEN